MRAENLDLKLKAILNPYGKTKAARGTIPMTDDASTLLKRRLKVAARLATPYVFPSRRSISRPEADW